MQNLIVSPNEENQQSEKEIKAKKSLNRRFGFLLIVAIILAALIIYEIVSHFIQ